MKSTHRFREAALVAAALTCIAPHAAHAAEEGATRDTLGRVVELEGVEVSTSRAGDRSPTARTTLGRDEVRALNVGQDTPMALAKLPGAYAYSDAGNGIGYSYLSVRAFPQRRISVHINGVPLNDPQSHEVYWIDHPDLLASASEVQLQRGVGSALHGAASLGGSVNIETSPFSRASQVTAIAGYGSWDTKRFMVEGNSGDLPGGWNLYGRYSRIESEGYRDDAWSKLWSYSLSARKQTPTQSFRVNFYGGPEETRLTYLGIPASYMNGEITGDAEVDRRFNPILYPNERDHFFEPHYELIHAWSPNRKTAFTQTLFIFEGDGFFDERRFGRELAEFRLMPWQTTDSTFLPRSYYRQGPGGNLDRDSLDQFTVERFDLVRRRTVANRHFGWIPRVRVQQDWGSWTVGGELRAASGRHDGQVTSGRGLPPGTPAEHVYYDYTPRTFSGGLFARAVWEAAPQWLVSGDLSWRHQSYFMRDDQFDGVDFDQSYDFVNPRAGVTWTPRPGWSAFASYARSSREPAFRDLYDAEGVGSKPLYRISDTVNNVYEDPLVVPESVDDFELGGAWQGADVSVTLNLFRMNLRDELVFAGQFNTDLGYATVGNAAKSVHQGIEFAAHAEHAVGASARLMLDGNATISDNSFDEYREVYGTSPGDTLTYDGKAIGFFPATIARVSANLVWNPVTIGAAVEHAGRIYVDNNEDLLASIGPRTVLNLLGAYRFPLGPETSAEFSIRVNNALDDRHATSGYMDFDAGGNLVPHFIPAATRNVLAQFRIDF